VIDLGNGAGLLGDPMAVVDARDLSSALHAGVRSPQDVESRRQYPEHVQLGVLGPLRVQEGGAQVEIRRGISRTLLIALLLRARETVSASSLMELLWGDDQPRNPANALQIQISYLRKTLSSGSASAAQPIVTRPGGYALDIEPDAVDTVRFERLLAEGSLVAPVRSDASVDAQLQAIDAALELWRGEALSDVTGESFAQGTATRLEEMRWSAHEQRIDLLLAIGRHREAVAELGRLVSEQPLRERFYEQLVLALYRCGRQADALRAVEAARSTLVDELGLDPGPGLQALELLVLSQDVSLDWEPLPATAVVVAPIPTRTAEWRRNFVPAPLTALIGRDTEVRRIRGLLARSRLVTLTGPGGAGKTRLAIDISSREAVNGQVWYVDLSSIDLPELVASTVADALGATTGPNEDAGDVAAAALAAETGLLVLDTCEHVLAGASNLASTVLHRAPGMKVLATSRRPLAVAGEAAWPVPPLGVAPVDADSTDAIRSSPAVALFCERAQDVRPDFELSEGNAADVAGICLALDGLPLAIELAAARADVLSPRAILDRLQDRFQLLVQGATDVAARQQTLRGAIDWSLELLSDEQRCFFARLGAFAGGFDLDAAEAVAGDGSPDSLSLLSSLVRHSMVAIDGGERFRLLDTLRAYAAELLADLDADDTRRRHARYYTEVAEGSESLVRGASQRDVLARLRTDVPNFRAALEWSLSIGDLDIAARLAGSLAWFWALDGRLDVADRHLRRAIGIDSVPAETRAKVLWGYSLLVAGLGNLDEALEMGEASTALARESGDSAAIGYGLNAAAVAHWALGDLDAAADAHEEAIERFVTVEDLWGESICRVLRARTALDRGDADSEDRLRTGLDAARRCGDAHVIGIALGLLAQLQANRGERDAAIESAHESLRLQESIGYTEGTIAAHHLLARLHLASGDTADARDELLRGLRLAWKMQHAAAMCEALEDLAQIASNDGDDRTATELLSAAEAERTARNLPVRPADRPTIDKLQSHLRSSSTGNQREIPAMADVVASLLR
jgi:predicted ATPase/DNA-binding SARP family transcriptional activator